MLKNLENRIRYAKRHKRYLNRLKPYTGGEWDDKELKKTLGPIKASIRTQLDAIQNGECAYCGLSYEETSGSEIEHIAPKGGGKRPRYTQFTFTPYNLVLACHLCNHPQKKGQENTIDALRINYKDCRFNIVHPYFDSPEDHFEWVAKGNKVLISYKTPQGKRSIEIFDLAGEAHNQARAKKALYNSQKLEDDIEQKLQQALNYL
jgi:uncharacterized protein (TIGR02646 family)